MQVISCWDVQVWDGADRCNHKFFVATKNEAEIWTKANTYDSIHERKFEIYDTVEEYLEGTSKETKARALAKLTPIERKALGF